MEFTSEELLQKLLQAYSDYFDITADTSYNNLPVNAEAAFHSRSEKYVLIKKAQLWAAEAHEYVFMVRTEHLDAETFETYRSTILEEGLSRVEPKKDHMYTYVTLLFLAESIAPEAGKLISKTRYHKDYKMSVYGWTDYRVAAQDCATGKIYTNRAGRELKKTFLSVTKKRRTKR